MLARAVTPEDFAAAYAFARAAGLPVEPTSTSAAAEPEPHEPPEVEILEDGADDDETDEPPALFMGQNAARVEMFVGVFLPVVEGLADLAKKAGVDTTTPRKRVAFKGTPLEREISADPIGRLTDLIAVEAAGYFAPKEGEEGGTGEPSKSDRRIELLMLGGVTLGPLVLPLLGPLRSIAAAGMGGVKSVLSLFRVRR